MSEEIVLSYELSRDMIRRGLKNQKIITRFCFYTHEDFVKKYPLTACDIIFVVDTSGSMDSPFASGSTMSKRDGVASAIESIIPHLSPQDSVSLICYDSNAYVELDHAGGDETTRIKEAMNAIFKRRGATNFEQAFKVGNAVCAAGKNASKKMMFLTDGNSTVGSIKNAKKHNRELAEKGVTVDCLGVGNDFNFKRMQQLSAVSSGRTELLDRPETAGTIFTDLLEGAQSSLINNAVLRFDIPAGSRDIELYQLTPEIRYFDDVSPSPDGSVNYRINLRNVTQTNEYYFVIRSAYDIPEDSGTANLELMKTRLDFDIPILGEKGLHAEQTVSVNLTDKQDIELRDTGVDSDFMEASIEKLDQETNRYAAENDWKTVAKLLNEMSRISNKLGYSDKAEEYKRRFDSLKRNEKLSQEDLNMIGKATSTSSKYNRGEREADNDDLF
jgi:hypothetical protein